MPDKNYPYFLTGQLDVTAAVTPEKLPAISLIGEGVAIVIKSKAANTGAVSISINDGTYDTSATPFVLDHAKDSVKLYVKNTDGIQIEVAVDGEGVEYIVETIK